MDDNNNTPDTGKHYYHTGLLKFDCSICHYETIIVDFMGNMPNGRLDVVFDPDKYPDAVYEHSFEPNEGTCTNVICHSGTKSWSDF